MEPSVSITKEKIIKDLITRRCRRKEAARELGVTPRTVYNYLRRYQQYGPDGLKDRRTGNHRKLSPEEEAAIVAYKQERPQRSVRLIRDRLGLHVSEEAVRLILVKHHLNKSAFARCNGDARRPLTSSHVSIKAAAH